MEKAAFKTKEFTAKTEKFPEVWGFVSEELAETDPDEAMLMQLELAVEEVFVNIASYAYPESEGKAEVGVAFADKTAVIRFVDGGVPFNPLEAPEPDTDLPAEERGIGGLGIFLVKEMMDDVQYRYENGKNVLTFKKLLG